MKQGQSQVKKTAFKIVTIQENKEPGVLPSLHSHLSTIKITRQLPSVVTPLFMQARGCQLPKLKEGFENGLMTFQTQNLLPTLLEVGCLEGIQKGVSKGIKNKMKHPKCYVNPRIQEHSCNKNTYLYTAKIIYYI